MSFLSKIQNFFKKEKAVIEKIEDVVEKVEVKVDEVKKTLALFEGFEDKIHETCVALFLKYFFSRKGETVLGDITTLLYRMNPIFKPVVREIINHYKLNSKHLSLNEFVFVAELLKYFSKVILSKNACSKFRKDVLALAETIPGEAELIQYMKDRGLVTVI